MEWFEMLETTEEERLLKEIAECNHCVNGLIKTMKQMKAPQKKWSNNIMIKTYLERIDKAKLN